MKNWILGLLLLPLLGGGVAKAAPSMAPLTFVHSTSFTLTGDGTALIAFQNTSSDLDVFIHDITLTNGTTSQVAGDMVRFLVFGSASMTHGDTSAVGFNDYQVANAVAPTYISLSVGPSAVVLESAGPIIPPLFVDSDYGASAQARSDGYHNPLDGLNLILLKRGANRGIIVKQETAGATNITDGLMLFHIRYTVR